MRSPCTSLPTCSFRTGRNGAFLLLAVALLEGCREDYEESCAVPLAPEEPCDIEDSCCQQKLNHLVAQQLQVSPLEDLEIRTISREQFVQEIEASDWLNDQIEELLENRARFHIGIYRKEHEVSSFVDQGVRKTNVTGYYEYGTRRLTVIRRDPAETSDETQEQERDTLAHELTHAYQDDRFDLIATRALYGQDSESRLGYLSAIEGHASFISNMVDAYLAGYSPEELDFDRWESDVLSRVSEYVHGKDEPYPTARSIFPYTIGQIVMERLWRRSGFDPEAIVPLLRTPPPDSARVLSLLHNPFSTAAEGGVPRSPLPEAERLPVPSSELLDQAGLVLFDHSPCGAWDLALLLCSVQDVSTSLRQFLTWQDGALYLLFDESWTPASVLTTSWADESSAWQVADLLEEAYTNPSWKSPAAVRVVKQGPVVTLLQAEDEETVEILAELGSAVSDR